MDIHIHGNPGRVGQDAADMIAPRPAVDVWIGRMLYNKSPDRSRDNIRPEQTLQGGKKWLELHL